ncbi:hypothetical protein GCM10011375_24370 [Hymenobacter qilianensis]|uniref:T9SS type A sorting domain-containing protein n=2 Tax=Hymenobacter qilianensis TaxID=1385715 RepID=A0A7H0GW61_9BACT|nr:T9SS type A sorting domain-containing protein [Hymenobacter qilianensis]QNP52527.1 T9SS type A sorting domain-containing protein [Hymenobacter qilianensis]GGF68479.1 hypothetical protein GCM10011375_24370 [Hymenobacter qilianensis]
MKSLHIALTALGAVFLSLGVPESAQAQFRTPVVDGASSLAEYGNQYASPNGDDPNLLWRMTWDDNNLYVAVQEANLQEGTALYIDTDPQTPVNVGGGNVLKGYPVFSINGNLPIQADVYIYIEKFYREYRIYNKESGQWGPAQEWGKPLEADKNIGQYADNGGADGERWSSQEPETNFPGTIKEFSLPWSRISTTLARPKNFNWFGYNIYGFDPISLEPFIPNPIRGGIYGQVPRDNESSFRFNDVGDGRYEDYNWTRYFTVLNTDTEGATTAFGPNGLDSYAHTGPLTSTLQSISVYDFTLNTAGALITRTGDGDGSIWNIQNNLTVASNSTLNFGSTTAPVIVGGDVLVVGEGTLRYPVAAGTLRVGRNIRLATGNSLLVNAGVTLTGAGAQTISTDNSAPVDFRLLTVQDAGVKTIASNLDIREALIINNGILSTGANEVRLRGSARLTENATGYLLGRVSTSALITNTPGATSDFGGIGLRITQRGNDLPGNIDVLRITGGRGLLQSGTQNAPLQTIARRFFINNNPTNNSGTNVTLEFTYRDIPPTELNGNSESQLRLYESNNIISDPVNGYQLVTPSSSSVPSPETNTLTYTGPLRLNRYFSLADGTTPLPVELISFTGKVEGNNVRLNWATASELQNKGFEIEQRTDLSEWKTIGFVKGNGTTNQRNNYTYLDRSATAGVNNYYRLRQIDLDGKSVYSQPVTVQLRGTGPVAFSVSPVPTTDILTLNGLGAGKHVAEIYNARGQRVMSQEFNDSAPATLSVRALPVGVYMVRVLDANRSVKNARFIKQ